ncbi:MAG: arylsulfatase [Salinivenus sp.]
MSGRASLLLLVLSLSLLLGGCTSEAPSSSPAPNVVVILADDMGYGDVGGFNPDAKIPTPHLDRLAEQGMMLRDAHSPGTVCMPTRYGLLTGRHPHRERTGEWRTRPLIDADRTTLASLLGGRGYATYMVGKWHLGFEGGESYDCSQPLRGGPVDRGFDHYFGIPASLDIPPYFYIRDDRCVAAPTDSVEANYSDKEIWTDIQGPFWRAGKMAPGFRHEQVLPRLTDETLAYLDEHEAQRAGQPFFLYFALPAPHTPWLPPDSLRGASGAGLYGDFVAQVDRAIGRVLDRLERMGARENTLVVFTSDNGPVWYDEDDRRFGHRAAHVYRGMKGDAWEGGHRVPLVARWPGHVPAGTSSDQLLTLTDLLPTIAALTGPALAPDSTDGTNLGPVITADRDSVADDEAVIQSLQYLAVRDGPWKLIPGLGSGGFSSPATRTPGADEPTGQLYHLGRDPAEQNNLYDERPEVVERLTKQLRRYRRQRPGASAAE